MKTNLTINFSSPAKQQAFERMSEMFSTMYPSNDVYLYGNLSFENFSIDALLVKEDLCMFFELKENTTRQSRCIISSDGGWTYNGGSLVSTGKDECDDTVLKQVWHKRNMLYRRLQCKMPYIFACVVFVNSCTISGIMNLPGYFRCSDLPRLMNVMKRVEKLTIKSYSCDFDGVVDYLNHPTYNNCYVMAGKKVAPTLPVADDAEPAILPEQANEPGQTSLLGKLFNALRKTAMA